MRYKIEYLSETTKEESVVRLRFAPGHTLAEARKIGWEGFMRARQLFGAHGFQIRDGADGGRIVDIQTFDGANDA
jgi:hypothetical protein